jgi:hypothetical protein
MRAMPFVMLYMVKHGFRRGTRLDKLGVTEASVAATAFVMTLAFVMTMAVIAGIFMTKTFVKIGGKGML